MQIPKDVFLGNVVGYLEPKEFVNLLCVSKSVYKLCKGFPLYAKLNELSINMKRSRWAKLEISLLYNNYLWMSYYQGKNYDEIKSIYIFPEIFRKANFTTLLFLKNHMSDKHFAKYLTNVKNTDLVLKILPSHDAYFSTYLKHLCQTENPSESIIDFCLNFKHAVSKQKKIIAMLKGFIKDSNTERFDKYFQICEMDNELNTFMILALTNEDLTMVHHLFNKYVYIRADIVYIINNADLTKITQLSFLLSTYPNIMDYNGLLSRFIASDNSNMCLFIISLAHMHNAPLYPASVHSVGLMIDSVDMIRKIDFIEPDNGLYLACKAEAISCIRYYLESGATNIEEMINIYETEDPIISVLLQYRSTRKRLKISVY